MAKASPIQTSFNAGELSPRMEGRVDIDKYNSGVSKLENFLPLVQGGALKRSGSRFVKEVRDSAAVTRLISFEFSTIQAYILEFGNLYMRVYRNNAVVLEPNATITAATQADPVVITTSAAHGFANGDEIFITAVVGMTEVNDRFFIAANVTATTFELTGEDGTGHTAYSSGGTAGRVFTLVTPYATADLEALAVAQSADILYIAHPSFGPRKLERTDHHVWTITEIDFDWDPFAQENLDATLLIIPSAVTGTGITLTSPTGRFLATDVGRLVKFREVIAANHIEWARGDNYLVNSVAVASQFVAGGPINAFGNEFFFENNIYRIDGNAGNTVPGTTAPVHTEGIKTDGNWSLEYIHSGAGYVEITAFTDAFRVTANVVKRLPVSTTQADRTITTVGNTTPIRITTSANHIFSTNDTVYIQGTTIGGINQLVFTITVINATQFDLNGTVALGVGSGGIAVRTTFSTQQVNAPYPQYGQFDLFAFGAWSTFDGFPRAVTFFEDRLWFGGSSGNPQTLWASKVSEYEDHEVKDSDEFALQFTLNTDQVNVIEWMNAGKVLVIGTAGGEFLASGAVETEPLTAGNIRIVRHLPYGSKSEVQPLRVEQVLLFVQRAGRKLRELVFDDASGSFVAPDMTVLADHILLDRVKKMAFQQEPNRLVWCVLEDGELVCFTYERSQDVTAWHHHPVGGASVLVESVAVIPHSSGDRDEVWLIVQRTINAVTRRYIEYLEQDWLRSTALASAFFVDSGLTGTLAPAGNTATGLDHLEGETVKVLADGIIRDDVVVSSGSITFSGAAATTVTVGLSYDGILIQLRLEAGAADGTSQGKLQRITNAVIRLDQTGRGLLIGPNDTLANMEPIQVNEGQAIPETGANADLIDGDTDIMPFPEGYSQEARVTLRHNQPLPCTIIAIMPQVVVQDR
ncbi:MAG: hypothetical protein V3R16_02415 [Nitrospirales bacterium]